MKPLHLIRIDLVAWCALLACLWAFQNDLMIRCAITLMIIFNISILAFVATSLKARTSLFDDWDK